MSGINNPPAKSKPVIVIPPRQSWSSEFTQIGKHLRNILKDNALRIDHIGSTSVPNLAAKDIIDIQITVTDLNNCEDLITRMNHAGFNQRGNFRFDYLIGIEEESRQLKKLYFREAEGQRRAHIHARQQGFINQQYPLLFRDFLRANSNVRECYQLIKQRLAAIFPESIDGYLHIKDPMMDIIYQGAKLWAESTEWRADDHYL